MDKIPRSLIGEPQLGYLSKQVVKVCKQGLSSITMTKIDYYEMTALINTIKVKGKIT